MDGIVLVCSAVIGTLCAGAVCGCIAMCVERAEKREKHAIENQKRQQLNEAMAKLAEEEPAITNQFVAFELIARKVMHRLAWDSITFTFNQ